MSVLKSLMIVTILIVVQLYCSDAGICFAERSEQDETTETMCPQDRMSTSDGNFLPCIERVCDELNSESCELNQGYQVNNTLIDFIPHMCLTNDPSSQGFVGFMFNWTLPAGQAEITALNILVKHREPPQTWILLNVNLTGHVNIENEKTFFTDCLASRYLMTGRNYFISVQVLPGEERYHFRQPFTFNVAMKQAMNIARPISEIFCNRTVAVSVPVGFPPGITRGTNEFQIIILLRDVKSYYSSQGIVLTVQAALALPDEWKVYFYDVEPGTYQALTAFLDEYGRPCGHNFYSQRGITIVKSPPDIHLQSHSFCNGTVEVNLFATFNYGYPSDYHFNITVILAGTGANEELTKTVLVTARPSNVTEDITKVYFNNVPPGNYTVTTKFADEYYEDCGSNNTENVTVGGSGLGWLQFEDYCYKLISPSDGGKSVNELILLCMAQGPFKEYGPISHLADVQSQSENEFIAEVVAAGNRAWLGAFLSEGNWHWLVNLRRGNESGMSYTNWKPHEPNNYLGQEDCIEINRGPKTGRWNDLNCNRMLPGVCKYSIAEWSTP